MLERFVFSRRLLGTVVSITIYESDEQKAHKAAEAAFKRVEELGKEMNRFDPDSDLSRLNATWNRWVKVSDDLFEVIRDAKRYWKASGGVFDVTVLPLMEMWDFSNHEATRRPSADEIRRRLESVGCDGILLDEKRKAVKLTKRGMGIDLGGIAKGYAVKEATKVLKSRGIAHAIVAGGGNIAFVGAHPERKAWYVGVRNPAGEGEVGFIEVAPDEAVATSGNYERYVILDGKRYAHILDPRTGMPVCTDAAGVTIVTDDPKKADAFSTAVFVMGREAGMKFVESRDDLEAVILTMENGRLHTFVSSGLKNRYHPFSF